MGCQSISRCPLLTPVIAAALIMGLTDDCRSQENEAPAGKVSFAAEIAPLLREKCGKCHGPTVQKGELSLASPALIRKGSESGAVIVPGKSAESRLFEVIEHGEMPPDGEGNLTESQIESIRKWIEAGAVFDQESPQEERQVTQHDVIPVLLLRCTICHGRHKQEGGLDLRNRESMLRGGKTGPALVLGKPDESLIFQRILAEEMPPHARLTEASVKPMEPAETKTLARWIELGAPLAPEEPELAGTEADPLVRPEERNFWSFRPPQARAVPRLDAVDAKTTPRRIQSPVDIFIAQKLIEKGVNLSPQAERLVLLRRLCFDLTGLPPTPAETEEFLADSAPDSLDKLVDRLLASPHYGERWGRHWLDVAGYAETEGRREQHLPRPFAWRYRDYVIRSMNSDKPYDRFLLEQIAGDDLADYEHATTITQEMEDNLVATAFLRLAPDPTWANLTGFVPDRLEVTSDSIDVLGAGVMGLTMKCARCHTHKFDPIPQRDYYRLVAIFKGAYDEHDWLKPQLISYGGAMSAGLGERYLPFVTTAERQQWEQSQANIQRQLDELGKQPKTPEVEKQMRDLEAQRKPEPRVMALWDRGEPSPTYVYRRGNYVTAGSVVTAGAPSVLSDPRRKFEISPPWPGAKSTGRRLAFARWLTEPDQPLTARVFVNRIWKHHFGRGIVSSLGNFGKTGALPSHPELLDFLARDFMRRGWALKSMHRQLVSSATYQQASLVHDDARQQDPDNALYSRMPLQRLDAEELRDAMLLVAGELKEVGGGPSEPVRIQPDGLVVAGDRRSIYVQQLRKSPPSLLESFDLPAMNPNCIQRTESLVPTQALHLWNDAKIRGLAERLAARVLESRTRAPEPTSADDEWQIDQIYGIVLNRRPRTDEKSVCVETLTHLRSRWLSEKTPASQSSATDADRRALAALCHTLFNSADFLYLD